MRFPATTCVLCLCLLLPTAPAAAAEREELEKLRQTTNALIESLVEQGVLTREKADALIREAEKRAAQAAKPKPDARADEPGSGAKPDTGKPVVRVPYVPESVKQEIRDQVKEEVLSQAKAERWGEPGALPEWLDRITLEGDIRLRYQSELYPRGNAPFFVFQAVGQDIDNTTEDRERWLVRARLGLLARVAAGLTAGLRLTTGNTSNPVSTNQTTGTTFNKYSLVLDRAYVKADPYEWLTISGGRMPNPWLGTDLVWDDDLNFDGLAVTLKPQLSATTGAFLTFGGFPVQEIENQPLVLAKDKWLYGAQAGLDWVTADNSRIRFGAGLFNYRNTQGVPNTAAAPNANDLTAPQFRQKGNTLFDINAGVIGSPSLFALAPEYKLVNLTGAVDLARFDPVHVVITGDYVKNIGFDRAEILSRTGLDLAEETKGYLGRVMVGMPQLRQRGDWQAFVGYKHLEADAVLDAFTDSDFHLGGTNAKGYFIGANYGIARNAWVGFRWLSSTEVSGPPLSIDVLQIDFNVRF